MTAAGREQVSRTIDRLAAAGYHPALAARRVAEGKYSQAVELCREILADNPQLLSAHLIYGKALYLSGQAESAAEQFRHALALDPDNLVALKYLADIHFTGGEEMAAITGYSRILAIDPNTGGLASPLSARSRERTRTITLGRGAEEAGYRARAPLRPIPFFTETMGDIYLSQGHFRLAAEVYRTLSNRNANPRLRDKLTRAEGKLRGKDN
jgi:tetratricopeptide (TPR) repeat protein